MDRYDSIIIGAGHNGLVCAAYLAQARHRVLVLEASATPGGLAATCEFFPDFRASVAHTISHFSNAVVDDLDLASHGYAATSERVGTVGLNTSGEHVLLADGTVSGVSAEDADAYADYRRQMRRFARALEPFWHKTMPRIGNNTVGDLLTFAHLGINLRRLGKKNMREFLRIASLPARDLMDEYFDNVLLKATMSWDGITGARLAPRSPNCAVLAILYRMSGQSAGEHSIPRDGVGSLVDALIASAGAGGAEIRCNAPVDRILIDSNAEGLVARGVQLADGERIEANRIVSAADPKRTFLNLVGVEHLDIGFTNRIRRLRCDGYVAKLHLALDSLPEFRGLERADGRMIIAPHMDAIEFAFDDAKYGNASSDPVMEVVIPSLHDASLAPEGKHVLSAHVMYVPYRRKGGWTDEARAAAYERVVDTLDDYAPGIREHIIAGELLTPADLERSYRVTGGHWHHTEFAMDQMLMMRPTYEAAQYGTPIPGLFLCSAGSHPGGDLTGAAGRNAAREILR